MTLIWEADGKSVDIDNLKEDIYNRVRMRIALQGHLDIDSTKEEGNDQELKKACVVLAEEFANSNFIGIDILNHSILQGGATICLGLSNNNGKIWGTFVIYTAEEAISF